MRSYTLRRSDRTGLLLSNFHSAHFSLSSSAARRYTPDTETAMEQNDDPQEPGIETPTAKQADDNITTASAWIKPSLATKTLALGLRTPKTENSTW